MSDPIPSRHLPDGPTGRAIATGVTLLAVMLSFFVLAPLHGLYRARQDTLAGQRALLDRTHALVERIPALQRRYTALRTSESRAQVTLPGANDAEAAAGLVQTIQALAAAQNTGITSQETLPARRTGHFRAISVRIALTANWADLVALLNAIRQATPRLLVDDLSIQRTTAVGQAGPTAHGPVDSTLTVIGYRPDLDATDRSDSTP